jgi:hypothetical protein
VSSVSYSTLKILDMHNFTIIIGRCLALLAMLVRKIRAYLLILPLLLTASRAVDIYVLTGFRTIAHALFLFQKITRCAKPLGILVYVKDSF